MAELRGEAPGHWWYAEESDESDCECETYMDHFTMEDDSLAALDNVIRFLRGDGYAMYRVVSIDPPVLDWVPFGDRWQVEPALIRGLTSGDLENYLEGERKMRELFG